MVGLYEEIHGETVIILFRILLGVLLLTSEKLVCRRCKEFIVTTYYGILVCVATTYISNLKISGMIIGSILGLAISVMLTAYNKTEHLTNLIVLFIALYEMMEIIVYVFNIDFYPYATNIREVFADHRNMYFKAIVAFYATIISYIVISSKEKVRNILEKEKFFWLGIFFVLGAIFSNTKNPLDIPDESVDLYLILWNINYSHYELLVPIFFILVILIIRICIRCMHYNTK